MRKLFLSIFLLANPALGASLVEVRAGAPGVIAVVLETTFLDQERGQHTWPAPVPIVNPNTWLVNGASPKAIHRYTVPYDALKAQGFNHPVKVRHRIYLDIGEPLVDGRAYKIRSPYGDVTLQHRDDKTRCEAIKVNQGGYHPLLSNRFANFGVFLGDGGSRRYEPAPSYRVLRRSDGSVVSRGKAAYLADDTAVLPKNEGTPQFTSGEHVYRLSLKKVPEGGPYVVVVPGCGHSYPFEIGMETVRATAKQALRGLYHQRCGIALDRPFTEHTRAVCALSHRLVADTRHPFEEGVGNAKGWIKVDGTEPIRHVIGGWHDAGDFDRRIEHIKPLLWWLSYYEALQDRSPWNDDGWLNIPESGNGIPDLLDEALWALRSWEDLQVTEPNDPDFGGVLAGTEADGHPGYGSVSAATDNRVYGTYAVGRRITAWSAGAFAHMSRLVAPFDARRAKALREAARRAWLWMERDGLDDMITPTGYAAVQLYLTTAEEKYHNVFKHVWQNLHKGVTSWPEKCLTQNQSAQCQIAQFAMYFHPRYKHLSDVRIVGDWLSNLVSLAESSGYHCDHPITSPPEPYPHCIRAFGDWGAQVTTGLLTDHWIWAWILLPDHPRRQLWFDAAALLSQFTIGLNPMNMSFYTEHGSRYPISSAHLDSYYSKFQLGDGRSTENEGNPNSQTPGLLIFGPTEGRSGTHYQRAVTDKLHPSWNTLPRQRRWGDGWPAINQNELTSKNMAYQALLYTFLASVH